MSPALLDLLQQRFPDSSRTTLRKLLTTDRVRVNGAIEHNGRRSIARDDRVDVSSRLDTLDPRIVILYQDDDLVVVNKSEGLLTVANASESGETAEAILNAFFKARPRESRVHVVQRLDRDTSGALVFARNLDMRDRLQQLFAVHEIDRVYIAIVHGRFPEAAGTLRSFLAEDASLRVRSVASVREGKEAITHYLTLASGAEYSMLEVTLETGRRNQIRVHLSEAGHPVVGDPMYGRGLPDPMGRLALHARDLGFEHPRTRERMSFTAPVPIEFNVLRL
jgi:23S rRNA pseudouridine1911/1915/1917 synthase